MTHLEGSLYFIIETNILTDLSRLSNAKCCRWNGQNIFLRFDTVILFLTPHNSYMKGKASILSNLQDH